MFGDESRELFSATNGATVAGFSQPCSSILRDNGSDAKLGLATSLQTVRARTWV